QVPGAAVAPVDVGIGAPDHLDVHSSHRHRPAGGREAGLSVELPAVDMEPRPEGRPAAGMAERRRLPEVADDPLLVEELEGLAGSVGADQVVDALLVEERVAGVTDPLEIGL